MYSMVVVWLYLDLMPLHYGCSMVGVVTVWLYHVV